MWSDLTRNKGFAVEINDGDPFWSQNRFDFAWLGRFKQVKYVTARQFTSMADATFEELVFTKHAKWSSQREWRFVLPLATRILRCIGKDEWGFDVWVADLPPRVIRNVICGPFIPADQLASIRECLRGKYAHVLLHRVSPEPESTGGNYVLKPVS
jgi:hypothetical protein